MGARVQQRESGFSVVVRDERYEVTGATLAQLRAMAALLGPGKGGERYVAYTAWELRWEYARAVGDRGWAMAGATVTTVVTRTLPRWTPARSVDAAVVRQWEGYVASLAEHEEGHVLIGAEAGRALYEALKGLPACETREALDALAGETAARVSEEYRVLEIAYDAETGHGATQGCA